MKSRLALFLLALACALAVGCEAGLVPASSDGVKAVPDAAALAAPASVPEEDEAPAAAVAASLVVLVPEAGDALDEIEAYVRHRGGNVLVAVRPAVLVVTASPSVVDELAEHPAVWSAGRAPIDAARLHEAHAGRLDWLPAFWQDLGTPRKGPAIEPGRPGGPDPLVDDFDLPRNPERLRGKRAPASSISIQIFLPESVGSENTETWTVALEDKVIAEVTAGFAWWSAIAPAFGRSLTFKISAFRPSANLDIVGVSTEPILHSSGDQCDWMDEMLENLGYWQFLPCSWETGSKLGAFLGDLRKKEDTGDAFAVFVVNSVNDADGKFTNGRFGYASLNGPYVVMTTDNDGWGLSNMDTVLSHETGHLFGASDEYCSPGYACCSCYDSILTFCPNRNCDNDCGHDVPCLMKHNTHTLCPDTLCQIGWSCTKPETCNNLDDDCDWQTDETGETTCGKGVCSHVQKNCENGVVKTCDPMQGAKTEKCDGLDNDCDGSTDEGLEFKTCGKGVCLRTIASCSQGVPQTCEPFLGASAETCDGLDNDCDGFTDEGLGTSFVCGIGACARVVGSCSGGQTGTCDDPMAGATPEKCNGVDDDCDGSTDEGLGETTCGLGACRHSVANCAAGVAQACDPMEGGAAEVCDGSDNDCNGSTDEGLGMVWCGLGLCEHAGPACQDGALWSCDPMAGAGLDVCDGDDNDCDGATDEDFPVVPCGLGECFRELATCDQGVPKTCDPFEGVKGESCDGLDNDCDGSTDDDLGLVECGVGECFRSMPECSGGVVQYCTPGTPSAETCDGKDNDCDGSVDEDLGEEWCGVGGCYHASPKCQNGQPGTCEPLELKRDEVCNGVDDDCDGATDEALGAITCGKGPCEHTVFACLGGVPQPCDPFAGVQMETCDNIDNDCDGSVDDETGTIACGTGRCAHEAPACVAGAPGTCDPMEGAAEEVCNLSDDDCDGVTDEDLGTKPCGSGACLHDVKNCVGGVDGVCDPLLGATDEVCNGVDDDCDGVTDEVCSSEDAGPDAGAPDAGGPDEGGADGGGSDPGVADGGAVDPGAAPDAGPAIDPGAAPDEGREDAVAVPDDGGPAIGVDAGTGTTPDVGGGTKGRASGGCSAGGAAGPWWLAGLLAFAFLAVFRPRRPAA